MHGEDAARRRLDALTALIEYLHPSLDADAAIRSLMRGHASTRALPEMSVEQLSGELPQRTAELVSQIPGMARSMLRNNYPANPFIGCFDEAARFLRGHFLGLSYENCYLLLMRKNKRLIRDMLIQSGSVSSVPFYTRNIVEAVIAHRADAIVISHNHPGGTAAPSQADVDSTVALIEALRPLRVPLIDHIIIADDIAVSIREIGATPEEMWLSQPCGCPSLLNGWFTRAKR